MGDRNTFLSDLIFSRKHKQDYCMASCHESNCICLLHMKRKGERCFPPLSFKQLSRATAISLFAGMTYN